MTGSEFCADIKRIYNRLHNVPFTTELDNRQIMYWLNQRRSKYIEQQYSVNQMTLNDQFFQELKDGAGDSCICMERVDKSDCDKVTYGCPSLRIKIQDLVYLPDMASIRVNMVDKITRIYYTTPDLLSSRLSTVMGQAFNWATVIPPYLYVIPSVKMMENFSMVNIRGIFHEPEKVAHFDFYNDNYPCPAGILADIKTDIMTKELRIASAMTSDSTNNMKDDH